MATIKRKVRKKYGEKHGRSKEVYETVYNTSKWKNLRHAYYIQHPLCELCLKEDIIKPTEEIHHIIPILTGKTQWEKESLAFDSNNLIALCKECHKNIHNKKLKRD